MAYPENLLSDGEHVVLHKHPHWKMLVWPVILFLVVVGVCSYLAALADGLAWRGIAQIVLLVVGVVLVVWLTIAPLLRWRTTHFIVTTDRVMSREGILNRNGLDIPLSRINSVQFRHGIVDRLFGCGTLVIESASEEPLEFDDIPGVEKVHTLLYREINDNQADDFAGGFDEYGYGQYEGGEYR